MQIISNGIFKSPMYRVVVESKKERISVAMFHLPQYEVEIGPGQCLIDENRPRQYKNLKNYRGHYYDTLFQGKAPLEMLKFNAI
uniref:Isopenicillin N synthase-like Fe(2+) 2OG dioxygenase domain-containing protein n=1 Tax=Manihot esculenta TaxID=3983 RepID=A0A2C9UL25_MANES